MTDARQANPRATCLAVRGASVGADSVLLPQAVGKRAQLVRAVRIVAAVAQGAVAAACKGAEKRGWRMGLICVMRLE